MPNKRATKDIPDLWRGRMKKIGRRGEETDSIFDDISDEDNSDSPVSDSTYNLEDDISPPEITPRQPSQNGSDVAENLQEEMDPTEYIIPPFLFYLPSATRALNIQFNRCLLLDIEPRPSTSSGAIYTNNFCYPSNPQNSARSSSSSESISSDKNKFKRRVTFNLREHVEEQETKDSVSTDGEVKTNYSPKSHNSSSLESYSDEFIPKHFFKTSRSLENEDDSKATDLDVCEMPDMYVCVSSTSLDPIAEIENDENDQPINNEGNDSNIPTNDSCKNNSSNESDDSNNVVYDWSEMPNENSSENNSNNENDSYETKKGRHEKYSSEEYK